MSNCEFEISSDTLNALKIESKKPIGMSITKARISSTRKIDLAKNNAMLSWRSKKIVEIILFKVSLML